MAQEISFFQVLKMLFILAIILVAVYYVTKFVASRSFSKGFTLKNRSSKAEADKLPTILYRHALDKDTSIMMIEYDGYDYLLGVASGSFNVIEKRKLSEQEINNRREEEQNAKDNMSIPFAQYMDKLKQNLGNKGVDKN